MRRTAFVLTLVALPSLAIAQGGGSGGGTGTGSGSTVESRTTAKAQVSFDAPKSFSAEGKAKLEAMYQDARSKELPPEPMARRVAEGEAKGATEAQILASVSSVQTRLESTQRVLVRVGREPRPEEIENGASAMERGVTEEQLSVMAERTPEDRSLGVAFDVLTQLSAGGVPVTNALAQVQAKLDARAGDRAILSLLATVKK